MSRSAAADSVEEEPLDATDGTPVTPPADEPVDTPEQPAPEAPQQPVPEAPQQPVPEAPQQPVPEAPQQPVPDASGGPSPDAGEPAADAGEPDTPPLSENRRRAERTAPLFAELATLEKDDPRRERLREILVEEHLPLVRHFARRFSNRGEPFDDLLQVGTLGLIAAIDRFDPTRGVEFLSFAVPTITGEIKRHFRDQGWSVRVPRRLQELHLSLNAAVGELAQKNGRAPTPSELAEHLGIPRAEVLEGLAVANAYRSSSLDERLSGEDDSPTLAATLGEEDAALEGVEYRESLQPLLATIPARERRILILRFFGNMTQSQIAADIGISQMHVSRLLSQTLAKLREGLLKD
ncbi:RNA polymerase, sigma 28 subunit, SigD/FliA/WhiG [Blastococcus sp. DSM 46786]|uniref:RNA polymerase sigma factor SigF n=1 Tax=Blastococcus sp. DSM 46786 TaxID=1798227 RepID=UPI0008D4103F|nr:RNA polymerase sigma factor SigF [Blastococcus sp. DSM 46786]SEL87701.1 RNA polymerase, sigma 28 subunit, SigD/FliA/WhiG [Blastococcus sp. DSM 46786]